jgi:hypothetical protein
MIVAASMALLLDSRLGRRGGVLSSLRLAKPDTGEPATSGNVGHGGREADLLGGMGGSGAPGNYGAGSGSTIGTHEPVGAGDVTDTSAGEQELAFTLMTSITEETKRESVRLLLRNLANAIDEGKASYTQLMVKIIVQCSVAESLAEDARVSGTSPTLKSV